MKVQDFERLQQKIEDKKAEKNKALGMIDQLTSQLKKDFEITDIKDAESQISILANDIREDKKEYDNILKQLDELTVNII